MTDASERAGAWTIIKRSFASIWVVGPGTLGTLFVGLGVTLLALVDQRNLKVVGDLLITWGIIALFIAAVAIVVRLLPRRGELLAAVAGKGEHWTRRQATDRLALDARRAGDDEAVEAAARLGQALARVQDLPDLGTNDARVPPKLRDRIGELWDRCLANAGRLVELRRASLEMATDAAARRVLDDRRALAADVSTALDRLEASLDHARLASLSRDGSTDEMNELAASLERGLEIARRVDARLTAMEDPDQRAFNAP